MVQIAKPGRSIPTMGREATELQYAIASPFLKTS